MSNFDPSKYTVVVKKQNVDDNLQYSAQALEFPLLYICADTPAEAYNSILETINEFYEDAIEDGDTLPEPIELADQYTGRVTLRMPKSLHKQVDLLSKIDGSSINQFVVGAVSSRIAGKHYESQIQNQFDNFILQRAMHSFHPSITLGAPAFIQTINLSLDAAKMHDALIGKQPTSVSTTSMRVLQAK